MFRDVPCSGFYREPNIGHTFLIDLHKLIGTYDNNQGRSVVFPSRYAQGAEEKRVPKAQAARGVWGHAPPEHFLATFGTTGIRASTDEKIMLATTISHLQLFVIDN